MELPAGHFFFTGVGTHFLLETRNRLVCFDVDDFISIDIDDYKY